MNKKQIKLLYEKYKTDDLDYKSFSYAVWAYENEMNLRKTLKNKKLNVFDFIEKEDKRLFTKVVKFTDNQAIYTNPRYLLIHNLDDSDIYQNCYIDKNLTEVKESRELYYPPYQRVIRTDLEKTFLTKEMLLLASKIKASKKTKKNKSVRFLKENENPIFIVGNILEKVQKFLIAYPEAIIRKSISNNCYCSIHDEATKDEFIFMTWKADDDYYATVENNEVVLKLE